jgi:DNA topoisomerase-2
VMIMADQDPDGSHIKGLLINLFHYYWPNLLKHPGFLQEFATPIVKAKKKNGKSEMPFFTLQEYEDWRQQTGDGLPGWTIKYYKGLGTSSSQEAKEYFSNLPLHVMDFSWEGAESGEVIEMVFSKKRADDRKQWLLKYESDLYVDHNQAAVTYSDFVNKELIHFSMMDNMRSIPSLIDGLKPGQRKILFACFKRKLKSEIKVAQLAGYVAEHSAYHHGEQSLAMAIVNMAQTFVGSNNINMLVPSGQFGTRLQGGADAASPRYIFTFLNSLTRSIFNEFDDPLLKYLDDDGQSIEPEWYMPILPTVLINGGHGIGTGWSTDVPSYNPRDIVDNLKRMMNHEVMEPMHPWFRGFKGQIELNVSKKGEVSYAISGILGKVNETTIQVTELPIGKWTQQYKEFLETMLDTDGGKKEPFIKGYREFHTDTSVHFEITMSEKSMKEAEEVGLYKKFQLQRNLSISNMHLFNAEGQIAKYDNPEQIMREFFDLRLGYYAKRKDYMVGDLERQLSILDNKCRFIKEVIAGTLKVSNRKKVDIVADLKSRGYAPQIKEAKKRAAGDAEQEEEEDAEQAKTGITAYDYLLNMPIMSLTLERVKNLQADRDEKDAELGALKCKSPADLWTDDLDQFMIDYEEYEADEERKANNQGPMPKGKKGVAKGQLKKKAASKRRKSWGASDMSESESDGDVFDDDDSDDEFMASKAKKKKPAAAAKQAAKRPREDGPATTVTWIPPPKATIHAPVAKKEPAAKKQDTKDTPDKAAFKTTKINNDSDSDEGGTSLFERLNAKVGGGESKKLFNPPAAAAAKKPKAAAHKKKKKAGSDDDSECSDDGVVCKKKAPARKTAAAASKKASKKASSDDDGDFSDALLALEDEEDHVPKEPKQPRRAAAAKAAKYVLDDSEEEEEEESDGSDFEPSPEKVDKKPKAASKPGALSVVDVCRMFASLMRSESALAPSLSACLPSHAPPHCTRRLSAHQP